jgi:hypothetical protein
MTYIREQLEKNGIEVLDPVALLKAKKVEEMTLNGLPYRIALNEVKKGDTYGKN